MGLEKNTRIRMNITHEMRKNDPFRSQYNQNILETKSTKIIHYYR